MGSNYVTTEGCPFYFPDAHMAPYVDELMPNTRLILLLRNPVRLLSTRARGCVGGRVWLGGVVGWS